MTASAPTAVLPSFFGRQEVPRKPSCSCQAGVRQEASSSASSSRRKAGKRCTGEAKAYVSAWQGSAGYEAAEKKVESRKPGVSRYDSGPDIFDDDFPYSVAESRKEEGNSVVEEPTEIIFELSRRGYGWGEEIIPMVSVERRPLRTKPGLRNRSKTPTPWEEGSLEAGLAEAGVPLEQVESVAAAASAWRVTPGGRPLIDRWRRTRVTRNLPHVINYLTTVCGFAPGPEDIGAILTKSPQILLANPKQNDRWFRRVVELCAFRHKFGHCDVPEKWPESPVLSIWVERQRRAQSTLSEERLQILYALGFEFGEVAVVTQEWEEFFDMLLEWLMWHKEQNKFVNWNGMDWLKIGGPRAGQLAAWSQLQRELLRKELLPIDAKCRLDALGFRWRIPGSKTQISWMNCFGELMFAIERRKIKSRRQRAFSPEDIDIQGEGSGSLVLDVFNENSSKSAVGTWSGKEMERYSFYEHTAQGGGKDLTKTMKLDRLSGSELDSGTAYWFAKQRWLWRRGKLEPSKVTLFYCAGIDLNLYSLREWVSLAQGAANNLNGYEIWVSPPEETYTTREKKKPAKKKRLYVEPVEIKKILSDGGVVEWYHKRSMEQETEVKSSSTPTAADATEESSSESTDEAGDSASGKASKGPSMASIRRWVLIQQMLWKEKRLSQGQLRHLAFLGLTWILSPSITAMSDSSWRARYSELTNLALDLSEVDKERIPPRLWDWLMNQRALRRLGWLSTNRIDMLDELGFNWSFDRRTEEERLWDANLAKLLEFKQEHQHCKVSESNPLSRWLSEQQRKVMAGSLPALRYAQLEALGAARPSTA